MAGFTIRQYFHLAFWHGICITVENRAAALEKFKETWTLAFEYLYVTGWQSSENGREYFLNVLQVCTKQFLLVHVIEPPHAEIP